MKNLLLLVALSLSLTIGAVVADPVPAKPVVPVKEVEQAELIVRTNPVGAGQYAHVTLKGTAPGDMINYKVRPKPTMQDVINGVLIFNGTAASYEVEATVINWDTRKWQTADAVVTFGQVPPPKPPIVDPPVKPISELFFLIVRPDGPASPAFTNAMSLPGWSKLGYKFKDKTVADAETDLGITLPAGTELPAVVTLQVEGTKSKIVRGPIPLPKDDDGIAKLPDGVK